MNNRFRHPLVARLFGFAACLVYLLCPRVLAAQSAPTPEPKAAAELFNRGLKAAQDADLESAAADFEAAYAISPHPSVLYNLGQTYAALGRSVAAVKALQEYLEQAQNIAPSRRREVEALIAFHRKRIGSLSVVVIPADADVSVDARPVSGTELSGLEIEAGIHTVLATRNGYQPEVVRIRVSPNVPNEAKLSLKPMPVAAPPVALRVLCPIPDVRVLVDGNLIGTTPLKEPVMIAPGSHVISLERSGYIGDKRTVEGSAPVQLNCRLTPRKDINERSGGRLHVVTEGSRLVVRVDGVPYVGSPIPAGKHEVVITRPGYFPAHHIVDLRAGQLTRLDVTLAPTQQTRRSAAAQSASRQKLLAYATGAAGILLCGTAATLYLVNSERYEQYAADKAELSRDLSQAPASADDLRRAHELNARAASIQQLDDLSLLSGIAGTALLGTSVAIHINAGQPHETGHHSTVLSVKGSIW